eukprot:scaffold54060_cov32-Cyclotella_meneghiniana.AAC.4
MWREEGDSSWSGERRQDRYAEESTGSGDRRGRKATATAGSIAADVAVASVMKASGGVVAVSLFRPWTVVGEETKIQNTVSVMTSK